MKARGCASAATRVKVMSRETGNKSENQKLDRAGALREVPVHASVQERCEVGVDMQDRVEASHESKPIVFGVGSGARESLTVAAHLLGREPPSVGGWRGRDHVLMVELVVVVELAREQRMR